MKIKRIHIIAAAILLSAAAAVAIGLAVKNYRSKVIENHPVHLKELRYTRVFNDLNSLHLEAAAAVGIDPPQDREDASSGKKKLVEIKSCDLYTVEPLTYSVPFLTKGAAALLKEIGENFRDSLSAKGLNPNKLIITSLLRTKEDVAKLRKAGNINASENSSHCHATTFDIAYGRYDKVPSRRGREYESVPPEQLKMILGEVLRDLKTEEKCYVKYEMKQHCFHITSRR